MSSYSINPIPAKYLPYRCSEKIRFLTLLGVFTATLLFLLPATIHAAPPSYTVGLAIENEIDSNGNITVVEGSSVKVAYTVTDPDKLLNKNDKIQLLRVSDDGIVASEKRGKKKSGTIKLRVGNSQNEALYVRYIRRSNQNIPVTIISHPNHPGYVPLVSIPSASTNQLAIGLNALQSAPPPYRAAHYSEMFEDNVVPSTSECANWNAFRENLVPSHYSCVQIFGSAGKGATSCDDTLVPELVTALQDGTTTFLDIDGKRWRVRNSGSADIWFGQTDGDLGSCGGPTALRPCIGNANWGGIGTETCSGNNVTTPTQTIGVVFR